jgi:hypothetical protein
VAILLQKSETLLYRSSVGFPPVIVCPWHDSGTHSRETACQQPANGFVILMIVVLCKTLETTCVRLLLQAFFHLASSASLDSLLERGRRPASMKLASGTNIKKP